MKDRILFIYSIFMVVLLYGVHYYNDINLFYLLFGLTTLLILKPIFIAPVYFISALSGSFFIISTSIGSVSRYLSIIMILSLLLQISLKKKFYKVSMVNGSYIVVLILYNFLSSFFSITASYNSFFLMFQNIFILYLFAKYRDSNFEILSKLLYISAYITIILILIELYLGGISLFFIQFRLSINEDVNQNRFAMMLFQLGAITLIPLFSSSINKFRIFQVFISFATILILIVLTGSRTALIGYLLTIVFLYSYIYKNQTFIKIATLAFFLILFIYTWEFLLEVIPFMYRFSLITGEQTGGVFNRIYSNIIIIKEIIPKYLFFGVGLGGENTEIALKQYGAGLKPAHNIIIDTLAQIGVIGFTLYYFFLKKIILKIFKNRNRNPIMYLPILIITAAIFNGIGETIFFEKFFWNGLALGSFFISNQENKDIIFEK